MDSHDPKHEELAMKVTKELGKISVIDSTDVNRISVSSKDIEKIMDEGNIGDLKPCLYFPEQEKMIIFDPWFQPSYFLYFITRHKWLKKLTIEILSEQCRRGTLKN